MFPLGYVLLVAKENHKELCKTAEASEPVPKIFSFLYPSSEAIHNFLLPQTALQFKAKTLKSVDYSKNR